MEGSIAASERRAMPAMEDSYCIRSLSAPMHLSASGEICRRIYLTQGTTLTMGRSKKSCDVTFHDARVSRKHCQLRILPHSNTLLLLDGATLSQNCTDVSHFVENIDIPYVNRLHTLQQMNNMVLGDASQLEQMKNYPEDLRNIQNARKLKRKANVVHHPTGKHSRMENPPWAVRCKPLMKVSGQWKPSLNGIFVNGREFCARVMALVPGDEVSLVGPTEGGKSLDSDCPAAIGFVVEAQPVVEKAKAATSSLSLQLISERTVGDNFSPPDLDCILQDVGNGSSCKLITSKEFSSAKSLPQNQFTGSMNTFQHSTIVIPVDGKHCTNSDTQTGDSSTNHSIKLGSFDLQPAQVNEASSAVDLDHKLLSAFNLVNASIKLRSDLLNCCTAGSSQAVEEQRKLPLLTAEKNVDSTREISTHNNVLAESTMPTVEIAFQFSDSDLEKQVGDSANMKDACFSFEDTVKVGSSPSPQDILLDDSLTKGVEGYNMFVVEKDASVSPVPAPPSRLFDDAGANSSQFTRTLLVSSINHTVTATGVLSQMLDAVLSERSVTNCLPPPATNGDHLEGFVSENPLKEEINILQTLAQERVKDENSVKTEIVSEHSIANDTGLMTVKGGEARWAVMQVNGDLSEGPAGSREDIDVVHYSDNGCNNERLLQEKKSKGESHISDDGNQLELTKDAHVPLHFTDEQKTILKEIRYESSQTDMASSQCTSKVVGSISGNGNFMTVDNLSRTDFEIVSVTKVEGNVKCTNAVSQRDETCAVQKQGVQEKFCSLHAQRDLQCTCILGSRRTEIEAVSVEKVQGIMNSSELVEDKRNETYAVQVPGQQDEICSASVKEHVVNLPIVGRCQSGMKVVDFFKEDVFECTIQGKLEKGLKSPGTESAADKDQVFNTLQLDHGLKHMEIDCDSARSDDGATLETNKDIHRQDSCCTHSHAVNDEVVNTVGSRVKTGGYYLNHLDDVMAGASGQDNTVHLWDLLDLTDDAQALFIATFTYDMDWFLSSSGISHDIPVTVACHNARRCWSKASKDRCEKPYLDWPNVTLVYPPFPRSNAFGSKGQGIGCHHPKIFLVRRSRSLRVIVSSANLTYKQWFHVTNNVWWQDFSCRQTTDFRCLFRGENESKSSASPDFASQLAMFLAALLADVPSEAHWVTDLAAFDFSDADGSLVASVPGLHHPFYQNAPQFLMTLDKEAYYPSLQGDAIVSSFLGVVPTIVTGIKYRFCPSADRNGTRIRCLAAALNDTTAYEGSTMPVLLKRAKFLKADPNAVSVIVTSRANGCSQDLFLQQDLHDAEINTMETDVFDMKQGFIKLGFLTREVASWLAVLCDQGFFSFAACIWPSEALAVASGHHDGAVKLALYVFQGPKFSTLSPTVMTSEERGAFTRLLKSLHNTWGLWRLEKILCRYNWMDSYESDFYVASSSIGTSLDAKFLAAFAAAAGRRANSLVLSQESDPQWGCWTAEQEAANPSISIVFPTVERVRQDNFLHYGLLCFAESAWLRLKSARLLHDAVPHPPEREGFPMHIKVARRTFRDPLSSQPYGWMYCGSHNFSPAAWGRPIWKAADREAATDAGSVLGSSLHICNYELGIVLIEPPPNEDSSRGKKEPDKRGLGRFVLPFKVPPPRYRDDDRPATGKAMMEALMEMRALQLKAAEEDVAVMQSEDVLDEACPVQQEDEAACDADREEARAEQVYVEALWSQIDDEEDQKAKE
ncbi:hypothetical protein GOP47_0009257 [Adiantum capillus-veneris]|uniref:FHA domain-containing protein n=1 Tax=Adiantum capillus-veneris TaxID=13818 RepID=A0A9D4UWD7_ADICA|nr:hypothetical protein GOP47_0009257 [Adiantum capillus-veneris]